MTTIALPEHKILVPRFEFPAWVRRIGDPLKMLSPLAGALTPLGVTLTTPFSPLNISGLVAWYDFSDITTLFTDSARTTAVTADADPIGGVTDKSGNEKHAVNATSTKRLTYKTAIINSKSVGRSDDTDDFLSAPLSAAGLTELSIYGVLRAHVYSSQIGMFSWAGSDRSGTPFVLFTRRNSTNLSVYVNTDYRWTLSIANNVTFQFCLRYSSNTWSMRLNGVDQSDYSGGLGAFQAAASSVFLNSGYNGTHGDTGELYIYNTKLTGTNDINNELYLRSKWAIY